ncbi:hypothetical protein J6590_082401 [Homalodisca vitripennis]|nr:hypothetical protein J6590_082401 [Homalodisca vitripennis]
MNLVSRRQVCDSVRSRRCTMSQVDLMNSAEISASGQVKVGKERQFNHTRTRQMLFTSLYAM